MPSSLIFAGLVVMWLLILVPAVARRQQEVVRPSPAALSGRVLARPVRHRSLEVYGMDTDDERAGGTLATSTEPGPGTRVPAAREAAPDERDEPGGPEADRDDAEGRADVDDLDAERDLDERGVSADEYDEDDRYDVAEPDLARLAGDGRDLVGRDLVGRDERDLDERHLDEDDLDGSVVGDPAEGDAAAGYDEWDEGDRHREGGGADPGGHEPRPDDEADDRRWERPPAAFRPGRGGFDPEAAALAARARYAFRQRVVVGLLVLAVVTAGAALLVLPALWWVHGLVDLALVGYLVYLRRQVRMEEAIRARRAARMAGTRRPQAADDPALDEWARRGREAASGHRDESAEARGRAEAAEDEDDGLGGPVDPGYAAEADEDWTADDGEPDRVRGTGEPVGVLPAKRRTVDGDADAETGFEPALPRLQPAPPPPLPAGTQLVDVDEDDDEVPLDTPAGLRGAAGAYRRAAGE
ncbi:gephyrin-like molybdotransferase receptor GlpR [Pseudonocardia sp. RS010]|uniref:divisome protein SepX/GlpR n=1 Tax=Pseudonocardia sp. RS010 TaxID=3385979 RepID=UPI0039A0F89B